MPFANYFFSVEGADTSKTKTVAPSGSPAEEVHACVRDAVRVTPELAREAAQAARDLEAAINAKEEAIQKALEWPCVEGLKTSSCGDGFVEALETHEALLRTKLFESLGSSAYADALVRQ